MRQSVEERFWSKVDRSSGSDTCWLWIAGRFSNGYGCFAVPSPASPRALRAVRAHRFIYTLCFGPIPPGMFVCHHCDNPACVNPRHLFLGRPADNSKDMVSKGRAARGVRHPLRKLSDESIQEIRRLVEAGMSHRDVARRFGITKGHVTNLKAGRCWNWLGKVAA